MIINLIIDVINFILGGLFSFLPTSTLSIYDTGDTVARQFGSYLTWPNGLFPFGELLSVLTVALAIIVPGAIAYLLANWIWRHIPVVGGG